jgi:mercuric ion binding protein
VDSAKIDLKAHRAIVAFDPTKTTPELLTKATADAGFPSTVKQLQ